MYIRLKTLIVTDLRKNDGQIIMQKHNKSNRKAMIKLQYSNNLVLVVIQNTAYNGL